MAILFYKCLRSNNWGNKYHKKGVIYPYSEGVTPPATYFEQTDEDPMTRMITGWVDRDGTYRPGVIGWDDWKFPAARAKLGVLDKPDFSYTKIGLLFPNGDPSEKVYGTEIASHRMMLEPGTIWHPHVHYLQDEVEVPTFKMDIALTSAGKEVVARQTVASNGDLVFPYSSGEIHQILEFDPLIIDDYGYAGGTAPTLDVVFYRDDSDVAGDVVVKEFDIHCPFDAPLGSGQLYLK